MRWRIEKEVVDGQGQFVCGEKNCKDADELRSWEVNFGYLEHGEKKNALVKLRLCPSCSIKLNYHHRKKEVKSEKKKKKEKQKRLSKHDTQTSEASISENQDETEPSESPTTSTGENKAGEKKAGEKIEDDIWLGPAKASEEKSRDEEFESYFEDMFL